MALHQPLREILPSSATECSLAVTPSVTGRGSPVSLLDERERGAVPPAVSLQQQRYVHTQQKQAPMHKNATYY